MSTLSFSHLVRASLYIAACAVWASVYAQNSDTSAATCPEAWETDSSMLQGEWVARIAEQDNAAVVHLGPHPEWQGTVKGEVRRGDKNHAMVGDVNDGVVTLEESDNGINISATWLGEVTEGSCAREVRGHYQTEGNDDAQPLPFVLRKRTP
ncbi:MAG: hypothetical protein LBE51_04030 [Acidovorax sp.]|jgi:hypothetical protein|nr:hypothetical protein [Acidovorax sp.]